MRCKMLLAFGALSALAGCTPVDHGFGEAVRYDMAIQTVNPDPVYPADAAQAGDAGTTAAAAARRYRTGSVKPVEKVTSATSGSGAGAGPK